MQRCDSFEELAGKKVLYGDSVNVDRYADSIWMYSYVLWVCRCHNWDRNNVCHPSQG